MGVVFLVVIVIGVWIIFYICVFVSVFGVIRVIVG